jgi:formylglycine-generating enzyme required for sulfatase activity
MKRILFSAVVLTIISTACFANSAPVVSNVTAVQRNDDSKLVDIRYNLADADGDTCTVWAVISDDGGTSWKIPAITFTGNVGSGITSGNGKHIIWDAGKDVPGKVAAFKSRVYADDGKGPANMVLVPAGGFAYQQNYAVMTYVGTFQIDKYEVTNDFYCQYLNNADPTGAHYDPRMEIMQQGTSGNYNYTVAPGKGQYPIRFVSVLDAEAFAAWRSSVYGGTYRLPTEQEWEKAAGWNPATQHEYTYGFQQDILNDSSSWCNISNQYGGPLPVGSFNGTGGKQDAKSYYGCYDMSGNVYELTSSTNGGAGPDSRIMRGGFWSSGPTECTTIYRAGTWNYERTSYVGFRLVLDLN